MVVGDPNVFIQVKPMNARPIDVRFRNQMFEHLELRRSSRDDQASHTVGLDGAAEFDGSVAGRVATHVARGGSDDKMHNERPQMKGSGRKGSVYNLAVQS